MTEITDADIDRWIDEAIARMEEHFAEEPNRPHFPVVGHRG